MRVNVYGTTKTNASIARQVDAAEADATWTRYHKTAHVYERWDCAEYGQQGSRCTDGPTICRLGS